MAVINSPRFFQDVKTICAVLNLLKYLDSRNNTIYYGVFVFPYLQALHQRHQGELNISTADEVIAYLKEVEDIIQQEITRANLYNLTEPAVRMIGKVLYTQLISTHREQICDYEVFSELVCDEQYEHLRFLYQSVCFDEEAEKIIATNIERFILSQVRFNFLTLSF